MPVSKKFKLSQFEDIIPDHILSRGYTFYNEDCIKQFRFEEDSVYASVLGTDLYEVEITLDSNHHDVIDATCSCPYDQGPYCKHIASVLYRLNDEINNHQTNRFKTYLETKTKQELIEMLLDLADEDPQISMRYGSDQFSFNISSLIDIHLDPFMDDGFIQYRDARKAIKGFEIALGKAEESLPIDQFKISFEIIKKWLNAYQEFDDSDGYLSSIKYEALRLLQQAAEEVDQENEIIESVNEIIFFISTSIDSNFEDTHLELLRSIFTLIRFKEIKDMLSSTIKSLIDFNHKSTYFKYYQDEVIDLYYLFLNNSDKMEADEWMHSHLHSHPMKIRAIEQAFERKNYTFIIQICQESLEQDLGYQKEWHHYLVQVYTLNKQDELAHAHMKDLILLNDSTYYQIYKTSFEQSKWPSEVIRLLDELGNQRYIPTIYEKIMIDEKKYDYLLRYVKEHSHKVFDLYQHFQEIYYEEVKSIMKHEILNQFRSGSSKKHYLYRSHYLDTMLKAYGNEETKAMIYEMKTMFKNRKALNEVLDHYFMKLS